LENFNLIKKMQKIISKRPKASALVLAALLATVLGFSCRYLILVQFELDILDLKSSPLLGFFFLFDFNLFRSAVRQLLEEYFINKCNIDMNGNLGKKFFLSSAPGSNYGGSQPAQPAAPQPAQPAQPAAPQPAQPAVQPAQGPGVGPGGIPEDNFFRYTQGQYNIQDPLAQRARGFYDPITGRPHITHQPYLRNLSEALRDDSMRTGQKCKG
jgi:hypothetical protein